MKPRYLLPHDLLGPGEVCRALGISRPTLMRYRRRPDFPAPFVSLEIGPVWVAVDVEAWAAARSQATHSLAK